MLPSRVDERMMLRSTPQAMYFHPSTDTKTMAPWLRSLTSCTRSCDAATSCFATMAAIAFFNLLAFTRLIGCILIVIIHPHRISAMIPHVASTPVMQGNQDSVQGVHEQQQALDIWRLHPHGDISKVRRCFHSITVSRFDGGVHVG